MKIHYLILPALFTAFPLFADSSDKELELLRDISVRLKQLNGRLVEMEKRLDQLEKKQAPPPPFSRAASGYVQGKLEEIRLPEKPSEEQIVEYIEALRQVRNINRAPSPEDIQVSMYRKIGPGHLKTILPLMEKRLIPHLEYALPSLVEESDKEFILNSISQYPRLVPIILARSWGKEAAPKILEAMKTASKFQYFKPFLSGRTFPPEQRKVLVEIFCSNPEAGVLAPVIEQFPDVDFAAAGEKVWNRYRQSSDELKRKNIWTMGSLLAYTYFVVKHTGNTDALLELADIASVQGSKLKIPGYDLSLPLALHQLTGQGMNPKNVFDWVLANKDRLVFDKSKPSFAIRSKR